MTRTSTQTCSIEGCGKQFEARGMCPMHYQRWRKWGDPHLGFLGHRQRSCSVDGCERTHHANGFCPMHLRRVETHGEPGSAHSSQHIETHHVCGQCGETFVARTHAERQKKFCTRDCFRASKRTVIRCSEAGCTTRAKADGLCSTHYNIAYYREHADELRERARSWYERNPERAAENRRRRDPERMREMARDYYRRHREVRQAVAKLWGMSTAGRAAQARWQKANPDKIRIKRNRRRARMLAVPTRATPAQVAARMRYFGSQCWICGERADCVDHVKPLSRGGPDIASNMRPACRSCNSRKGDRWEGVDSLADLRFAKVA